MKVRYTLPVRGTMRLAGSGVIDMKGSIFRFIANAESGFVEKLEIDFLDIPRDQWPTLVPVQQDPDASIKRFPFDTNPNVVRFSSFLPRLLNLESLLGLFGIDEMDLAMVREEWLSDQGDEPVGILQSWGRQPSLREPEEEPVSDALIARVIAASNGPETETAGLAHLRVARSFFRAERYIDAIRYSYLAIEFLYAQGHHKKRQTLQAFQSSPTLLDATLRVAALPVVKRTIAALQKKYAELAAPLDGLAILEWAFDLRGRIQHGNPSGPHTWHPSRQEDFRHESTLVLNIAYEVCCLVADERLKSVKAPE